MTAGKIWVLFRRFTKWVGTPTPPGQKHNFVFIRSCKILPSQSIERWTNTANMRLQYSVVIHYELNGILKKNSGNMLSGAD
jgi:hypothetical protein